MLFLLLAGTAEAKVNIEVSRNNSNSSYANNAGVGLSSDLQSLNYNYSNSLTVVNLNPALSDFSIGYDLQDLAYNLNYAGFTLDLNYSLTQLNKDEAMIQQYSAGLYYKFGIVQVGFNSSTAKTTQVKDFIILSRNYKDDVKFIQKAATYYIDAQWTETFLTSLKSTYNAYDENLDNYKTLLTTQVALNRAGGSVANEVQSQLRNSAELNMVYVLDQNWLFELAFGTSQLYLAPMDRANDARLGVEYDFSYFDVDYKLFYSLTASKSESDTGSSTSTSHYAGLGVEF